MKKLLLILGIGAFSSFHAKAQFPAPYCSDTFQFDTEPITLVDFAGINNTTGNTVNAFPDMEDHTGITGNVAAGLTYPITLKGNTGGAWTNYFSVFVDWNQDNDFADPGEKYDIGSITGSSGIDAIQATGNITVPAGALAGTTRMRVHKLYAGYPAGPCLNTGGYGQIEDYTLSVVAATDCAGMPTAGTASGPSALCPGPITLTLTGTTSGVAGISIQWQSSPDGSTWSNIPGATASTYNGTISATTYYQAVVTCTPSGMSATSNMVTVTVNPPTLCYCTTSLHSSATPCIELVDIESINNASTGCALPAYTSYPIGTATTDFIQGTTVPISVTTNGNAILSVWIDFNQSGTFDASEWTQIATTTTAGVPNTVNVNIPVTALLGQTGMRVRARATGNPNGPSDACTNFGSGETEDYIVNIIAATPCSGTPSAGTVNTTDANICSGENFTLSTTGTTIAAGLTYQWYESIDNVTFTPIAGATGLNYTTTITDTMYYQFEVTCTASGMSNTSASLPVYFNPPTMCYCTTSLHSSSTPCIDNVGIESINNSSSTCALPAYTAYPAATATTDLMQGMITPISVTTNGNAILSVWIDYDHSGTFDVSEHTQIATTTAAGVADVVNVNVPVTALLGQTGMRVRARATGNPNGPADACSNFGSGETEDYIVNIIAAPTCSGTPNAGAAATSLTNVCSGETFDLSTTGTDVASDFTYQWFSSMDSVTFSPIAGATGLTYNTTTTDTTYYYLQVTCPTSGMSDISDVVTVYFNPFHLCLCEPVYTSGTGSGDYIGMVSLETINNITGGAPAPYYTYYTTPSATLSQGTDYVITVSAGTWSSTGNDLAAWIDYDHSGTFDPSEKLGETEDLGAFPATDSYVFTVPMTALLGATTLRVREMYASAPGLDPCASVSFGETEDYLINITPAPPCVNPPVGGIASGPAIDSIGNSVTYVVTGQQGDNIQWYVSTDSVTFSPLAGTNNDSLTVTLNGSGTVYYMAVMSSPGCVKDSSTVVATDIIYNDDVCMAFPLQMGMNGPYSTEAATVQPGEVAPAGGDCQTQMTWCNNTLDRTLWFTLVAPPSGRVSIHAPDFDSQLALWKANTCSDLLDTTAILVAANDDDSANLAHGGVTFSSFIEGTSYCLEPGATYYLQLDAYSGFGTTALIVTDLGFPATPTVNLEDSVFCGSVVLDAGNDTIPGISYLWSDGSTGQMATFTSSDTVTVTVTDSIGCKASDMAIITNDTPLASFSSSSPGMGVFNFNNTSSPSSIFGYSWNFGDGGTSTLEDPAHTYTFNGVFIVTLTVTNACGTDAISQTVTVTGIGITELTTDHTVKVYPNPASDLLNITSDVTINEISIVNTAGQLVFTLNNVNSSKALLDLGALVSGMYMVNVQTEKGTAHTQISVMK